MHVVPHTPPGTPPIDNSWQQLWRNLRFPELLALVETSTHSTFECWLKITDAENHLTQAIRCCDEVLALDADSVKAIYRRAVALEAKGEYDQAKLGLKRAAELAPDDSAVPKLMARVEAQLKRQADKEKKMYSKMFS